MSHGRTALAALVLAALSGPASAQDPLAAYRGRARLLIAVAARADDPRLAEQRRVFAGMDEGARERDLVLLAFAGRGGNAETVRRRFGLDEGFSALLVGKDGGEKLRSSRPIGPGDLFPLIDTMPMRQEEMRRRAPRVGDGPSTGRR